jgi:hypothetical protein
VIKEPAVEIQTASFYLRPLPGLRAGPYSMTMSRCVMYNLRNAGRAELYPRDLFKTKFLNLAVFDSYEVTGPYR